MTVAHPEPQENKYDAMPHGDFAVSMQRGAVAILRATEAEALGNGEALTSLEDGRQIVVTRTGFSLRYDRVIPLELRYRSINALTGESYCDAGPGAQPLWSQLTRDEAKLFIEASLAVEVTA